MVLGDTDWNDSLSIGMLLESLWGALLSLCGSSSNGGVPVLVEKSKGAFFRLVKSTTSRPPWQAATGGTRHGEEYQQVGRSA